MLKWLLSIISYVMENFHMMETHHVIEFFHMMTLHHIIYEYVMGLLLKCPDGQWGSRQEGGKISPGLVLKLHHLYSILWVFIIWSHPIIWRDFIIGWISIISYNFLNLWHNTGCFFLFNCLERSLRGPNPGEKRSESKNKKIIFLNGTKCKIRFTHLWSYFRKKK